MTNQHLAANNWSGTAIGRFLRGNCRPWMLDPGRCTDCQDQLAASAHTAPAATLLAAIQESASEHITFEQLDAWVEDSIDPSERELVSAHIGHCLSCARQLRDYELAAPAMSVPVLRMQAQPAQLAAPPVSLRDRLFGFLRSPQAAVAAVALLVAAIVGPYLALRQNPTGSEGAANVPGSIGTPDPLDASVLDLIPEGLKNGRAACSPQRSRKFRMH